MRYLCGNDVTVKYLEYTTVIKWLSIIHILMWCILNVIDD